MRVATWNINNVTKRLDLLLDWLDRTQPDIVALQELKTPTASFPLEALRLAGYESLVVGQRTWNGVALLARGHEPLPVATALPGDATDKDARYVEAAIDGVLYACLYLPNGNPWPGPKFDYKLRWFERLRQRAEELQSSAQPVVLLGDWNVVPNDSDIYKPDTWRDNALLQPEPRAAFGAILEQGWTDALKHIHPAKAPYTFWDYRRKRWERDAGLRIDHILVNAPLEVVDSGVDREERAREGTSDHAPVWAEIRLAHEPGRRRKAGSAAERSAKLEPAAPPALGPLAKYNKKRDFKKTAEPTGVLSDSRREEPLLFVVQKHWASRLHYDFRIELDGVMVSWAVPKGPSYDPATKQMAIHVEDHPVSYNTFEGAIPKGEYGGGTVIVWDRGTWEPIGDPREGLIKGKVLFKLHGQKLAGLWELVRISKPGAKKQDQWMLFKKRGDAWARSLSEYNVITALPDSVVEHPLGLVEEREPRGTLGMIAPVIDFAAAMEDAPPSLLPESLSPQLATLAASPPTVGQWAYEIKFDGYRLLARIDAGRCRLFTRNGNDWTAKMTSLAKAVEELGIESGWLDCEAVVMGDNGLPSFNALQKAFDRVGTETIQLFVFDVPYLDGKDLRALSLQLRRAILKDRLSQNRSERIRFSEEFVAPGASVLESACKMGLEGVIAKRLDSPYELRRTDTWLKLKCHLRQEFVIGGFTDRSNASKQVGSLVLGVYDDAGKLRSAGSVGTGWNTAESARLWQQLAEIEAPSSAFDPEHAPTKGRWSKRTTGSERWVSPRMVAEVSFAEWTPDGSIRHASFEGLREDKDPMKIRRETASAVVAPPASKRAQPKPSVVVKVTHGDRVIDASTGLTKLELVRYYESVADFILPHLRGRPCSLVRGPTGVGGQLFFQKHSERTAIPGLKDMDASLWPDHDALLEVPTETALAGAAQMNVIEFHTWNSTAKKINQPDRMIFDLDPGEGTSWQQIQEAAMLVRGLLQELHLEAWLKTSGGKGLHVVVPLTPKFDYETVKRFSKTVVEHLAKVIPSRFVSKSGPANRIGKLFVDYLRNGHGATTAAAFSARARPGLGVSMPVAWEELPKLNGGSQWTIVTAREHLSFQKDDPWADYWGKKQSLTEAMKTLGFKPGKAGD